MTLVSDVTEAPKSKITFSGITFVRTSEANLPNLDFGLTYFLGLLNSLPLSGSSSTKRLPCGRQEITRAYLWAISRVFYSRRKLQSFSEFIMKYTWLNFIPRVSLLRSLPLQGKGRRGALGTRLCGTYVTLCFVVEFCEWVPEPQNSIFSGVHGSYSEGAAAGNSGFEEF